MHVMMANLEKYVFFYYLEFFSNLKIRMPLGFVTLLIQGRNSYFTFWDLSCIQVIPCENLPKLFCRYTLGLVYPFMLHTASLTKKSLHMLAVHFQNVNFKMCKSFLTSHRKEKHCIIASSQTTISQETNALPCNK